MKIKYIQLIKMLNLPGQPANLTKLSANGLNTSLNGCVKSIVEVPAGFIIEFPAGHHAGFYMIPHWQVAHAMVEIPEAEQIALGIKAPPAVDEQIVMTTASGKQFNITIDGPAQPLAAPKPRTNRKPTTA